MSPYQLSPAARNDLNGILSYHFDQGGPEAASEVSDDLFRAFERLAETPGLGHRRSDLTPKPYYFHLVTPYLVVYMRQVDPLPIIGIFHTARNLHTSLRKR